MSTDQKTIKKKIGLLKLAQIPSLDASTQAGTAANYPCLGTVSRPLRHYRVRESEQEAAARRRKK